MPIYSPGSQNLVDLLGDVMQQYHARLSDVELIVDVLEARPKTDRNGEPCEEALKLHGYPCIATIKKRGAKDRGEGRGDALLTVDAYRWDEQSESEKVAILDHELTHLQLLFDKDGNLKRDDYGRPRLSMRLHDHQFGWFDEVAKRHPLSSIESRQAKDFIDDFGQLYLPGFAIEEVAPRQRRAARVKRKAK